MLKSIATARSECKAKHENKASYSTAYIVPDLIDLFGDDWKEIKTQTENGNIHNCKEYCIYQLKIGLLLVISEDFLSTIGEKKCAGHLYFLLKTKVTFTTSRIF